MSAELSPGLVVILGALAVPLLPDRLRQAWILALPALAFLQLLSLPMGEHGVIKLFDLTLVTTRVDRLSLMFGYIFLIATAICLVYSLHVKDTIQQMAGLVYAGGALGAVFAGDLVTLFIFWEVIAIASVFLIWAARNERAYWAGMRYLIMHVGSGVLLLAGILLHYRHTGSIAFGEIGLAAPGGALILLAIGIKCAFPVAHAWLIDAYPESTPSGTVFLSAFTTKVAVYALARGYAGTEILITVGAIMTLFPIFYAVIENDLRRVLSYSMTNQLGFMVIGVGIGTDLALNGAVAHAFADILFKGLLFMSMGAVLYRVGTTKASELGGLYKSMPWTTAFCIVGAASISALPLFSAFVTKSMIITAAMDQGYFWLWLIMLFASAGVVEHAGIKIPYFAFFAHDSGKRCEEAPFNMLLAMAIAASLCIAIGSLPTYFYQLLPYNASYEPFTLDHVVAQLQLLLFASLAVAILMRTGIYPPELRSTNLDIDWFWRRVGRRLVDGFYGTAGAAYRSLADGLKTSAHGIGHRLQGLHGPDGIFGRTWPTGSMAFWMTVMLGAYLILAYAQ